MPATFNRLETMTNQLLEAANARSICSLKLKGEEGHRLVHPHGITKSKQNKVTVVCWQKSGFSEKGVPSGYKNLSLEKCETVMVLNKKFIKRKDFNPQDDQYGEWVFHI